MIAALRAELVKVLRRRVLVVTALTTLLFAFGSAAIVLASAEPADGTPTARGVTVQSLSEAGGGTEVFTTAVSFAGTFLFVVFVGAVAIEFSRGTFRTMLLHQPRRLRLLAGKMAGLLVFAAAVLAAAEVLTWLAARLIAPSQDVATSTWVSSDALGHGLADYGSVLFWVSGYALLGMTVAVLVRSVPVALAVGIAWAGPFEHLLQDAWDPAQRFFPGLLLEAFVADGVSEVSATRAFLTVSLYTVAAAAIAGTVFARRDMTA
jgi:ABC-type transport system involved in multi-copper enzyme maturation permease subunit